MKAVWPHIRAALVALHVIAIVLMASPDPGSGMRRSSWRDPTVKAEFNAWTGRMNALGWAVTEPELEDHLWDFAVRWQEARDHVVGPFDEYGRYMGTGQAWRMFVAPHRFPTRLHIDIEENGVWRPLYEERSAEYDWRGRYLDHDRFRSAIFRFGWSQFRVTYEQFADWIAVQAAADFPKASRVRVRMYKYETLSPAQVKAGKDLDGKFQQEKVLNLDDVRATSP